jgi:RimJ/RimL family protein N-acetyltransferase
MSDLAAPWVVPGRPDVALVVVPPDVLRALAAGRLDDARALLPELHLAGGLTDPLMRHVWAVRAQQVADRPGDAPWVTRLVVDRSLGAVVGRAGFHGPPDEAGMVEVGYETLPEHRRAGYARGAFTALLDVARRHPRVRVLRATIAPGNEPSRALVAQYGLVEVGEQWDDEDGLETIFELPVA